VWSIALRPSAATLTAVSTLLRTGRPRSQGAPATVSIFFGLRISEFAILSLANAESYRMVHE
jgi:hypothetical protein